MKSRDSYVKKKPSNEKNLGLAATSRRESPAMGNLQTINQEAGAALHPTGSPAARLPIQPSKISAPKRRIISAPFSNPTSEKPTSAGKRTTPGEKPATKKKRKYSTRTTSPPDVQESPPVGVEATKAIAEDPAEEEEEAKEEGTKERALL